MSKLRFEDDVPTSEMPKKKKRRRQQRPSDGVKSERGGSAGNNAETKSTKNIRQTEGDNQNLNNTAKIGNSEVRRDNVRVSIRGDNKYDKQLETRDRVIPSTNTNKADKTKPSNSRLETKPKDNSKIRHKRKRIIDSDGKIINGDVRKSETSPKKRRNYVRPSNIDAEVNDGGVVAEEKSKDGSEIRQENNRVSENGDNCSDDVLSKNNDVITTDGGGVINEDKPQVTRRNSTLPSDDKSSDTAKSFDVDLSDKKITNDKQAEENTDTDTDTTINSVSDATAVDDGNNAGTATDAATSDGVSSTTSASSDTGKKESKLKLTKEEKTIGKLEKKSKKYADKLEKARDKMPSKTVKKKERIFNEEKGKKETKIRFDKEPLPIGEAKWNKPKPQTVKSKAFQTVSTHAVNAVHMKVYRAEEDNVGVKAAHRAELAGENAYKGSKRLVSSAYRFHKNRPYRAAARLETKSIKNEMKLSYQKALRDNPKLKSNSVSRFMQKRKIKRQYAANLKNAKKSVQTAKQAAGVTAKAAKLTTGFIRRTPVLLVKIGILLLIIFLIMSLMTMCMSLFSGGGGMLAAASYSAAEEDIDNASLLYTDLETDMLIELASTETTHSGYDEYRYNIDGTGHDPFGLISFLTAVYGEFTYEAAEPVLRDIFAEQYTLEFTPSAETRYYYDDEGNPVPYEWNILTVTLTSIPFTEVIFDRMTDEQRQQYDILMMSKGMRQYAGSPFNFNWLPNVSSYYGYRIHPITGAKDYHKGIDIALPEGTEILSAFDGTVVTVAYDSSYGNYVVIENSEGVQAKYAHCYSISVTEGQSVTKGGVIAAVGTTGSSTGNHVHMEIVKEGRYVNPLFYTNYN